MTARNDLTLEEKINVIKLNEAGLTYRGLRDKLHVSIGAISNEIKRKAEYMSDYENNRNKNIKRKTSHYSGLHLLLTEFQSKLIDIYLDSNNSKQKSILDFFQPNGS
ncbi:unnamed protein product [Adineta steineri]|uniref:Transposase IS30-like HTH domain-containing protein n=1 Tax=Adineta steineri TaxID=433720 RepID=A0A819CCB8_9BILA|nr:unnamed protein product [Adineta steineri]CAF0903644.1 unnamed protein product [Adineta steineri]CAF3817209.1 unnamed protein product [Adineta steineri]CAF3829184.1 unnamed protein product [Adineta steineri]